MRTIKIKVTMPLGVQCYGKENALMMFHNRALEAWSIWQGKQFLFCGIGESDLEEMLTMMESGSNPCYTLKVYRNIEKEEGITEKTPAAGSFNFYVKSLSVEEREKSHERTAIARSGTAIGAVQKKIDEIIAAKIGEMFDDDNRPQREKKSKLGLIGEIMDHPIFGSLFEKLALQWLSPQVNNLRLQQPGEQAVPMRAVGNISTDAELMQALEKLKLHDPKLSEHLKKLAALAELDNSTFNILISSIDKMKLE